MADKSDLYSCSVFECFVTLTRWRLNVVSVSLEP